MSRRQDTNLSVITTVYDTDPRVLTECIESVRAQESYNWELCLCDHGSTNSATITTLKRYRGVDPRIKIMRAELTLPVAAATNAAAQLATGEFLAFLGSEDVLAPEALSELVRAAAAQSDIDLLYTDEDQLDELGRRAEVTFKPDWSPEHLLSVMYLGRLFVIRKRLFFKLGGFRKDYAGAEGYDLALRASRYSRRIHHTPKVLYHRRRAVRPAGGVDAKPDGTDAARRALADHLEILGMNPVVENGLIPDTFRVRPTIPAGTPVTLLILTHDISRDPGTGREINLVRNTVRSIAEKSTYSSYRLLVVDDGNASEETKRVVSEAGGRLVSYTIKEKFNFSDKLNFCMSQVDTEQVIILNDDIEVITPDWIESLIEWTVQPEIGAAGGQLLYPDGTIQHAGLALAPSLLATHIFYKHPSERAGYCGFTHLIRDSSAVTGAVLATRASLFRELEGFDTAFATDFNDIDYCLRLIRSGRRIVYTPYPKLYHLEGSSLPRTTQNPDEMELFRSRWQKMIERDPYVNIEAIRRLAPDLI